MSHQFTTKQIQDRYASLPDDIKRVASSPEVAELLQSIGRQYKLRIDKTGVLIEQATLIMLGLIKSHEFVNNLTRELQISKEQAEAIAVDVDTQVFSRIRKSLREVQHESGSTDSRFEETSDYGDNPVRDSLLAEVEKHATDLPSSASPDVQSAMSTTDYNSQAFQGNQVTPQPTPVRAQPDVPVQESTVQPTSPTPETETPDPIVAPTSASVPPVSPAPPRTNDEVTKDFKQRLEEKMKVTPNTVNADPYKESIE